MNRIPFYLVALIVAIANTPLNIFDVHARGVGMLEIEPWRRKLPQAIGTQLRALSTRLRAWFRASGGLPAVAGAVACLVALLVIAHYGHAGHGLLVAHLAGLKGFRQRASDLKAEIAKVTKERAGIGEAAMKENRAMTADEKAKFLALGPTIDGLQAQLDENAELLAAAEAANEADRNFEAGRIQPDADAEAARRAAAAGGVRGDHLEVGTSAEEKLAKSPSFFGQALHAVRRIALREEQGEDRKLVRIMAGPTGASSDVPSDGGFVIAPDQANTIIQRTYDTGEVAKLVTRQPVTGNALNLPAVDETSRANGSRFGGITSTWIGQGTTVTAGKPKFRLMELKLKKLLAFVYGTDELVADAAAFSAFVGRNLPLELNFATEDAIINGDGSNKPQGILNSAGLISVTRNTTVRVLYEDVSGMWKRMWAPLRKTAVWIIDQSIEQELEQMAITIGTAGVLAPIYKPAGIAVGPDGTQGYSPATLYGRPILTTEYNAQLGTAGDIILTNLGEYTLIDKGGVDQAVSLDVAFLTDEAVWRFRYRADGQLNWNSPLTPKNGGATLSSVIALSTL